MVVGMLHRDLLDIESTPTGPVLNIGINEKKQTSENTLKTRYNEFPYITKKMTKTKSRP